MGVHVDFDIVLHVKSEDIKQGKPHTCNKCPIALALKRQFPDEVYFDVSSAHIIVGNKKAIPSFEMMEFIEDFDYNPCTVTVQDYKFPLTFTW